MVKGINIALLITGFSIVWGFVYWALGFLRIFNMDLIRIILTFIITLLIGVVILKNKKINKGKSPKH